MDALDKQNLMGNHMVSVSHISQPFSQQTNFTKTKIEPFYSMYQLSSLCKIGVSCVEFLINNCLIRQFFSLVHSHRYWWTGTNECSIK